MMETVFRDSSIIQASVFADENTFPLLHEAFFSARATEDISRIRRSLFCSLWAYFPQHWKTVLRALVRSHGCFSAWKHISPRCCCYIWYERTECGPIRRKIDPGMSTHEAGPLCVGSLLPITPGLLSSVFIVRNGGYNSASLVGRAFVMKA